MMSRRQAMFWVLILFPFFANGQDRHGCRIRREYDRDCTNNVVVSREYVPAGPVCVGQSMIFRAPWVITDNGASYLQVTEYTNPDRCPPLEVERWVDPVSAEFEWELFWGTNHLARGMGPQVSHTPMNPGRYSCRFKAYLPRSCDPPKWETVVHGEAVDFQLWAVWSNVFVGTNLQINASGGASGWASSDTNIATVREGLVTGMSNGLVTITATSPAGCVAAMEVRVLRVDMGMDGNRNDFITFGNTNDNHYLFWVNDDVDVISGGEEDDAQCGTTNCNDNVITCKRDLEDFTRLNIKVDNITANLSGITYVLKFENVTDGSPEVNLFEAVDESLLYLSDSSKADQQIQKTKLVMVGNTETNLPNQYIKAGNQVSPFILEGKSAGKGDLTLVAKVNGNEVCKKSVTLELHPIKWFYDIYKTDIVAGSDSNQWTVTMQTYSNANAASYSPEKNDYLLFVHGWNMDEWEKERWTETAFKRLWWQRYKGKVGLFSWPTLSGFWWGDAWYNTHHFDTSELRAWLCASNLASCCTALNGSGQLRVLAHSMGNVVAGEALRQYTGTALQTYIASQAAMSANYYDIADTIPAIQYKFAWPPVCFFITTPNIIGHYDSATANDPSYLAVDAQKAQKWCNYHNFEDYALRGNHWELDGVSKPDNWTPLFFDYEGSETNYSETVDHFYRWLNPDHDNLTVTVERQRYEIFSYCAESRVRALGAISATGWDGNFNLHDPPLNYDDEHYSHSREFRSNIVDERPYWKQVMADCNFTP